MPLFGFLKQYDTSKKVKVKKSKESKQGSLRRSFKASLGAGINLREAVRLPPGEDKCEWIAMNTMELFETMSLVYSIVNESCTDAKCPEMNASETIKYLWADGEKVKKPIELSAPQYVKALTEWIVSKFDDDQLFPSEGRFPKTFLAEVKIILKRMIRVYAHLYYKHLEDLRQLSAEGHVNTCFKHLYYFVTEFELVDDADMEPLLPFIRRIQTGEGATASTAPASGGDASTSTTS